LHPHDVSDLPAGVVGCLAKPYTTAEVLATVQEVLGR
jgi:hypothetical protein